MAKRKKPPVEGYQCDVCPEAFDSPQRLGAHKRIHHPGAGKRAKRGPRRPRISAGPGATTLAVDVGLLRAALSALDSNGASAGSMLVPTEAPGFYVLLKG